MKENLKDQLDVLLWLNQEFDDYNMQYFNQYFSKHFRPSVSVIKGKTYSRTKTMLLSLQLSSFERKQCNECKVYLLTLDIPEGFLVSSIIVVYSGLEYKVIISQQQCQHSPFEISKHHYSSININMKVFDTSLNKGLLFINNQRYI